MSYINSEYRCPDCRERAVMTGQKSGPNVHNNNKIRVGVIHSPTCKLYKWMRSQFPALIKRIEQERSAA